MKFCFYKFRIDESELAPNSNSPERIKEYKRERKKRRNILEDWWATNGPIMREKEEVNKEGLNYRRTGLDMPDRRSSSCPIIIPIFIAHHQSALISQRRVCSLSLSLLLFLSRVCWLLAFIAIWIYLRKFHKIYIYILHIFLLVYFHLFSITFFGLFFSLVFNLISFFVFIPKHSPTVF